MRKVYCGKNLGAGKFLDLSETLLRETVNWALTPKGSVVLNKMEAFMNREDKMYNKLGLLGILSFHFGTSTLKSIKCVKKSMINLKWMRIYQNGE